MNKSCYKVLLLIILIFSNKNFLFAQICKSDIEIPKSTDTSVFEIINSELVLDKRTNLIWSRCSYGTSGDQCSQGALIAVTWSEALELTLDANQIELNGYSDWRLPNIKELETIVEYQCNDPAINMEIFSIENASGFPDPSFNNHIYWTSTPTNNTNQYSQAIDFKTGGGATSKRDSEFPFVRLVRDSQSNQLSVSGEVLIANLDSSSNPTVSISPTDVPLPSLPPGSPAYNCPLSVDNTWGENCIEDRVTANDITNATQVIFQIFYDENSNGIWDDSTFICGKTLTPDQLTNVDCGG